MDIYLAGGAARFQVGQHRIPRTLQTRRLQKQSPRPRLSENGTPRLASVGVNPTNIAIHAKELKPVNSKCQHSTKTLGFRERHTNPLHSGSLE